MVSLLDPPLRPRNGHVLHVLTFTRISTEHQDIRSNDDQQAYCQRHLRAHFDGPVEWHHISGLGSGEYLDRKKLRQAEDMVASGRIDVVIVEDLARICRRSRAVDFCELCEDNDCRLIAINDHIDTGKEDWRLNASFATIRHEMYNQDTSKRIKRTLRNRFTLGGVFQCVIFGYTKAQDAESDAEVTKNPDAEPIYDEWFRMLEGGASYSEVADWLNRTGVLLGKYCRDERWSGRMVRRITFNPILKGERQRNRKEAKRINRTGHRRSVDAPPEKLLTRDCPHLQFIQPERYDRVVRLLQKRNEGYARGRRHHAADNRKGVSKKRTVWPGQHVRCGVCGRLFYWGGHGQKEHMQCSGSRDYLCWNVATFDGKEGACRLTQAILAEIEKLPEFNSTFLDKVKSGMKARLSTRSRELEIVNKLLHDALHQINNVTDAIAAMGINEVLSAKLTSLMDQRRDLEAKQAELKREPDHNFVPPTIEEIKREAKEAIEGLASDTPEFGRLMQRLVPSLKVYPYRLCDGGGGSAPRQARLGRDNVD